MVQQVDGSENGVHATGQPDTPVECLVDILERALQAGDIQDMRPLVEHAYKLASGLDPYLDAISTPPSQVLLTTARPLQAINIQYHRTLHSELQPEFACLHMCNLGMLILTKFEEDMPNCLHRRQQRSQLCVQLCEELIQASLRHPWSDEYKQVRMLSPSL